MASPCNPVSLCTQYEYHPPPRRLYWTMAPALNNDHDLDTPVRHRHGHDDEEKLLVRQSPVASPRSRAKEVARFTLLVGSILGWYLANGLSGIAMQSMAASVDRSSTIAVLTVTASTTAIQLFVGAVLGAIMMLVVTRRPPAIAWPLSTTQAMLPLLHAMGSLCANLGFMYGSAAVVQIIKLMEPFETLLLARWLLEEESRQLHTGVVSSMALTVGGALSLVQSRSKVPHPAALIFALGSGLALSSRNVLQRRMYAAVPTSEPANTSQLERSIQQFCRLSLQASLLLGMIAAILHWVGRTPALPSSMPPSVLTWHPLYNAFSMIVLGYCSALTHSLLNAGKRVFAIAMAILWFHEAVNRSTAVGLAMVLGGGIWYTVESKTSPSKSDYIKPLLTMLVLSCCYAVSSMTWVS